MTSNPLKTSEDAGWESRNEGYQVLPYFSRFSCTQKSDLSEHVRLVIERTIQVEFPGTIQNRGRTTAWIASIGTALKSEFWLGFNSLQRPPKIKRAEELFTQSSLVEQYA
ncbi:hypothetical protein [Herbaspirillum huttiense]|uniref:hypothetical protein n=1 Tax=Herbaspirillum huttiense TaxID=863372 RepID=UPI0039AEC987